MITFGGHRRLTTAMGNLLLIFASISSFTMAGGVSKDSKELQALNDGSMKFAANLFSVLSKGNSNGNLVVSPLSLQIALALVYAGANGKTKDELAKVLHMNPSDDAMSLSAYKQLINSLQKPGLKVASSVFFDQTLDLLDDYKKKVNLNFGAELQQVSFADATSAANVINNWCQNNTDKKIMKIFEPSDLTTDVKAVIANAIHFKANWMKKFDATRTNDMDFHGVNGITKVKMMHQTSSFNYGYDENLKAQLLELPYENNSFRMIIILPFPDTTLQTVENNLKKSDMKEILGAMYSREVVVSLPRFKIETEVDLKNALTELGVLDMFEKNANLSGISSSPLFISKVKQKAFIEVNEEGTEAAAVTVARIMKRSLPIREEFVADRPFAFVLALAGEPGSVMFYGTVHQPDAVILRDEL